MRLLSRLVVILFLVSGGLFLLGDQLKSDVLMIAGFLGLGLIALAGGIEMLIGARAEFMEGGLRARFRGLPARLWGIVFVVFGSLMVVIAAAAWMSGENVGAFFTRFFTAPATPARWGALLLIAGILVSINSVIRVLAGSGIQEGGWLFRLSEIEIRLSGALYLVIGLSLAAIGVLLILAPESLLVLLERLREGIVSLLLGK